MAKFSSLFFLFGAALATTPYPNATACTTLQPVFEPPLGNTSTAYESTTTTTSAVDCSGCSLVVSTFSAIAGTPTTTVTSPIATSTQYFCANLTATSSVSTIAITASPPTPTVSIPTPPPAVADLVADLLTAILYVELIANDGNLPKLCSTISPGALDAIDIGTSSINGSVVLAEVCGGASVELYAPDFFPVLVKENAQGVKYLAAALFAVEAVAASTGGLDRGFLCSQIDVAFLDALSIGGERPLGTAASEFVCGAAPAPAVTL